MRDDPQPPLFEEPAQSTPYETARTYRAIVTLRKRGNRVFRNGTNHIFNGKRVGSSYLILLAERA